MWVDFAYAVHTDVGNSAVGCKINGKFAPLSSELQNGDEVEVLTSAAQQAPTVGVGIPRRHRQGPRRDPPRHPHRGARPVCRPRTPHRRAPVRRRKMDYADDQLKGALPRLARSSIDDVMASVGRGELRAADVARAMYPDYKEERVGRFAASNRKATADRVRTPDGAGRFTSIISVGGVNSDLPVKFAPNGGAVRAIASSASSRRARASPSIRSSRRR